jgi:DNA-binding NtrC family response regulator
MQRSILVVDDDDDVAEMLVKLLTEEGYRVRAVCDGKAALWQIEVEPPDLVLADVVMPQVDGVALTRQLRARGKSIPVVLMSAVYSYVDVPGLHFISKPFNLDAVLRVITRVFEDQRRENAVVASVPVRARKWPRA